jgi:hypothetical protein
VRRAVALGTVLVVALAGVAWGTVLAVTADELTVVRVTGAVPAETCSVGAVADAYIDQATPGANFGSDAMLKVNAGPSDARALVRFDLASCSIPPGADVRSATLNMTIADAPGEDRAWKARRITAAWNENNVKWNTAPTVAAASTDTVQTGIAVGVVLQWNVLADVATFVSGAATDRGWQIFDGDEGSVLQVDGALASREDPVAARRPSLTVTWFD